jgi:uncharacterized membrane protein YhaH (DUF805 family)
MKLQINEIKKRTLSEYFGPLTIFSVVLFLTIVCFVSLIVDVVHETAYDKLRCLLFGIPAIVIIVTRFKHSNIIYKILFAVCLAVNCFSIFLAIWNCFSKL